jgi:hypothetical protein
VYHYFPTVDSSDPSCDLYNCSFDDVAAQVASATAQNIDANILKDLVEGLQQE